jgi:hypothetical protein
MRTMVQGIRDFRQARYMRGQWPVKFQLEILSCSRICSLFLSYAIFTYQRGHHCSQKGVHHNQSRASGTF